jgi:hypothetical protein
LQNVVDAVFEKGEMLDSVVRRWVSPKTQVAIRGKTPIFLQFHCTDPMGHPPQQKSRFFWKYHEPTN